MFKVGKKYICRGIENAYVEIISYNRCAFDKEEYPLVGILHQKNKATVRIAYTSDGYYIKNTVSAFDLIDEVSALNFDCNHSWQKELLFNIFHEYCSVCGIKR